MALARAVLRLAGPIAAPAAVRALLPAAPIAAQLVHAQVSWLHTPGGMDDDDLRRAKDELSDSVGVFCSVTHETKAKRDSALLSL